MAGNGRTVLITGCSSGFGNGLARELADRGYAVFATMRAVSGRNADVAEELLEWAVGAHRHLHVVELDVTDDRTVEEAVAKAVEDTGRLDVVVNNAGVGTFGPAETFTPEQVAAVLDVNVVGVHRVTRAALPHLRQSDDGVAVFVSSGFGRAVFPFVAPYAATKYAVEGLAESWAYELEPQGVETVIVEPGGYETGFGDNMVRGEDGTRLKASPALAGMFDDFAETWRARAEAGGFGDPDEVVRAMADAIDGPKGERPLRVPVGDDMRPVLEPINEATARAQERLMAYLDGDAGA